jgi:hypothetical protein
MTENGLSDNPRNPSPLMGEGEGGGVKDMADIAQLARFPLPFVPSHQERGEELSDSLMIAVSDLL